MTSTAPAHVLAPAELLALDQVFAAHGRSLLYAALRLTGDRQAAEDLLQDAFTKACARPERFVGRVEREIVSWLHVVMRRAWRDQIARASHRVESLDALTDDEAPPAAGLTVDEEAVRGWELAATYEGLARLSVRQRTAMVLLARGYTEQEAADLAGVTRRTMRDRRRDARNTLGLFGERLQDGTLCTRMQTALSALADDEMGTGGNRAALDAHLAHCAHCRTALAAIRDHTTRLQGLLPPAVLTAGTGTLTPPEVADVVNIGRHTIDTVGPPRDLVGHHAGMLAYLEEHWRMAASVVIATLTLVAVIGQGVPGTARDLLNDGDPSAQRTTSPPPGPRVVTVTVPAPPPADTAVLTATQVPTVPAVRWATRARLATARPQTAGSASRGVVSAVGRPRSSPAPQTFYCTTAECLFGP